MQDANLQKKRGFVRPAVFQVVQGLTELGLEVHRARISSDGGWFVDGKEDGSSTFKITADWICERATREVECVAAVFEITEANGRKVRDQQKLAHIQQMLNVHSYDTLYQTSLGKPPQYQAMACARAGNL